jgi:hypothetical protein
LAMGEVVDGAGVTGLTVGRVAEEAA